MKDPTAEKVIEILAEEVFGLESTDLLFNPYNDVDPRFDKPNASEIRRENVKVYVRSCFSNHKDATWLIIGEAPGPHGCRFSGVPFTNEDQLLHGCLTFSGLQSSKGKEPFHAPASKIFWKIMLPYALQGKSFFIWNCVPLHPHKNGKPLSVRNPTSKEIREYSSGLSQLLEVIQPIQVIAVGRKAQEALSSIKVKAIYARHPSMGGAAEFKNKMNELLGT